MDATRTTVANTIAVAKGMPLAAISAREEVPPCCVTVISAYACRQVALRCETVLKLQLADVWGWTQHLRLRACCATRRGHKARSRQIRTGWLAGVSHYELNFRLV